ncbi:MAG: CHASE2 domain-containing protein [Verrucomicrobiota bacterium]|jgi:CHASE2 domain-containing sensor protein
MARLKDTHPKRRFRALGCLLTALIGLLLLLLPDDALQNLSFDLPFQWRSTLEATNAVIIYFNQSCLDAVFQTNGILMTGAFTPPLKTKMPPDRRIYVPLLELLKKAGARLVFFDCNFHVARPGEDEPFARAIRENASVIIGGTVDDSFVEQSRKEAGVEGRAILPPNPTLEAAATNWGILAVDPTRSDKLVRRLLTVYEQTDAAVFLAAQFSGFKGDPATERWINWYGPAHSIDSVLLPDALKAENGSRFHGRAVFIGGNDSQEPDLHPTPYSRVGSPGVEILATSYLNLVQSDWLERWNAAAQAIVVAGWGVLAMAFFLCFRPRHILWLVPVAMAFPLAAGFYTQWEMHRWWSWAICSFVQTPVAAAWSMIANRWFPWPPLAFISYRRVEGEGGGYAQAVWSALEHRGCGAICDVKAELTTAPFRPQLLALIDSAPNFILILSRDALKPERIHNEDDVLRAEIRHALRNRKNIISVMIGDFKMPPGAQLPPDIRELPDHHAFVRRDENPWAVMDDIMTNLQRPSLLAQWRRRRGLK